MGRRFPVECYRCTALNNTSVSIYYILLYMTAAGVKQHFKFNVMGVVGDLLAFRAFSKINKLPQLIFYLLNLEKRKKRQVYITTAGRSFS